MMKEMGITRRDVIRYALLPGVIPRLRGLTRMSLGNLAYLMALVFNAARILPGNHPYLQPSAMGTFGIRHVIAQAANHLRPEWKYADQFVVFFAILSAIIILILQFILLIIAAVIGTSQASDVPMPATPSKFFVTPDPYNDIAFRLLDLVFGIPGLYNSMEIKDGPTPAQLALQGLFEFYSFGLLVVGCFIILYFVVAIAAETAQTGSPFGKRFNVAWAPIRLVLFFALLLPVNSGMNGGQMVALTAAKYGSGLATNGWLLFNEVIRGKYVGDKEKLVGKPQTPEMAYLINFMLVAKTCAYSEGQLYELDVDGYILAGNEALPLSTSFQDAVEKNKGGNIHIRFGDKDPQFYPNMAGGVYPNCGEITIITSDIAEPGAAKIQEKYLSLIRELWGGAYSLDTHAENFNKVYSTIKLSGGSTQPTAPLPDAVYKTETSNKIQEKVTGYIDEAVKTQIAEGKWDPDENMKKVGWAGAGIWYNKIAQQNGALMTAVANVPKINIMPRVMEWIRSEKIKQDKVVAADEQYIPTLSSGVDIMYPSYEDETIGRVLTEVYKYTQRGPMKNDALSAHSKLTGNIIIDTINLLFGTRGLYDMCRDTTLHPLAQLSSMGKMLIESSVRAMGFSVFSGVAGGLAKLMSEHLATAGFAAASFFVTVASIGLLLGFILFYVIPFMPFLYFFFGVGSWVKGLFEAMVGIPLWALAHLRIDGEGVPGEAAKQGYFLIFEIFIRPILMVFGLLAAIAIFAALVRVLNEIFYIVIANTAGHDPTSAASSCFRPPAGAPGTGTGTGAAAPTPPPAVDVETLFRGPIDEFFFTVIYAIIVYMIGVSCFKLIDKIPDGIMRWLEEGISVFGARDVDPAEGLIKRVAVGGGVIGSQLKGGLNSLFSSFSK